MSGFLSGWGVRLGIVAVIIIGGFILRDRLSSSAGDLKVGDCFDEPASGAEISEVQHHPCAESHTAEVVFIGEMTGENSTYPTTTSSTSTRRPTACRRSRRTRVGRSTRRPSSR